MNQDNRVLGRQGARDLTPQEAELVNGAFKVFTICTLRPPPFGDADCA
jgi:hypothetical protein